MKIFQDLQFNRATFERELTDLKQLLSQKSSLKEKQDILPFFRERPHLSSRIGLLASNFLKADKIAFEYDLFGDFTCDLVVGDSQVGSYSFIEFEDAEENSIFSKKNSKFQPDFSNRFEHGYSQIVDWFYKLNHVSSHDLNSRFHASTIQYQGILVIGRSHFLNNDLLKSRLRWRMNNVIVNSKHIQIFTFDELLELLTDRLQYYPVTVTI